MSKKISQEELQKIVASVPMLSTCASQLLHVTAKEDHELIDVIDLVRNDANLTARALKVVNSASFSLVNKITSIDRAVSYLGERIVVGVALGDCAGKLFEKELSGYEAKDGSLWRHDLRTAIASREVALQGGMDISPALAFTAGLLHDIGKALISDYLDGSVADAVEIVSTKNELNYLDAEKELVGFDHTQAGYELAKAWQLPEELAEVILHHHEPSKAKDEFKPLVYAVHLGDNIAMLGGGGTGSDSMRYQLDNAYTDFIKITPNTLATVMLNVDIEFTKLESSLNHSGGGN